MHIFFILRSCPNLIDVLGTVVRVHNADEGPDELRRFIELQIMVGS